MSQRQRLMMPGALMGEAPPQQQMALAIVPQHNDVQIVALLAAKILPDVDKNSVTPLKDAVETAIDLLEESVKRCNEPSFAARINAAKMQPVPV